MTTRMLLLTWSVLAVLLALVGGCGSSAPALTSIELTPASASVAKGGVQEFKATGNYDDDTTKDITTDVSWSTSDIGLATIDDKGVAIAIAKGSVSVSASLADGDTLITGTATLTITDDAEIVSIEVTPATPKVAHGTMIQLTATAKYADDTTQDVTGSVEWSSSDAGVATFSSTAGLEGLLVAGSAGAATITASLAGKSGTTTLTVTDADLQAIEVTAPDPIVAKGMKEQFTATGIFSDGSKQDLSKQAVWASSDPAVTISNEPGSQGLATAAAEGSATITATTMGLTGSMSFQVTAATLSTIVVTPFDPTVAKGTKIAMIATGILSDDTLVVLTQHVQWDSSNKNVATVSAAHFAQGVVTGVDAGTATISATYGDKTGSTTLTVTPATLAKLDLVPLNPSAPKGTSVQFVAIGTFSDQTAQDLTAFATWGSTDAAVAALSSVPWQQGLATALTLGTTTISASVNGESDSTTLTVTPATLSAIDVTPSNPSIAKGTSIQLSATGIFSDNSTFDLTSFVTWSSSDASAAVSNAAGSEGVATGLDMGSSTIKATFGSVAGATTLTVTTATLVSISVTPTNPSIAKGTSIQLTATGIYSDDSNQDLTHWVTWSSSDASVAVSNAFATHGLAAGMVQGSAVVTASFFGKSGSTNVAVTAATLSSLEITPADPTIAKGTQLALHVIGTYSDNSVQDLSESASWSSSSSSVAISNTAGAHGLVFGLHQGSAIITASFGGKSATTTVTVTAATLSTLQVNPMNPTIAKGTALWFTVTGIYSDASKQDLTNLATWLTSDPTKALISNAAGSRGLATAVSPGEVTITAHFGGVSGATTLTVTTATLVSIEVTPADATVAKGFTKQLTATGTFTDSTVQDITTQVTWVSSDMAKVIISNAVGSKGLATGVSAGTTTISAVLGKLGATSLTVTP